ncbi:glycosyltransferase family 4 protein [Candidatus Parcubacteria bacterium]|nr:glycosyltransferase family 4 protein [Candidatus Parcubacteria bacterium]
MRILIYQPRVSYYVGGGEIVPINQAKLLIEKGFDVIFVTSCADWIKESDIFKEFKNKFSSNIIQVNIPERLKKIYEVEPGLNWERWDKESIHFGLHVKKVIDEIDYDVAFFHAPLDLIALNQEKKNIGYLHGYPESINYACLILLDNQSEFIAVSDKVKEKWDELLPNKNIEVIYNGIDNAYFCPSGESNKIIDLLFVGRLIENKGIINLLPIFKKITNLNKDIRIAIVGDGPLSDQISNYIVDNNLEQNIHKYGYLPHGKLLDLYKTSRIGIFPSISKEGLLTTVLEATSCGVPAISSKGLGLDVYIKNGINGFLINPNDEDSIVNLVVKIINDEQKLNEMSDNARKISLDWGWDKKIEKLEKVLKRYE